MGAGDALAADTNGARKENLLSFKAVLTDCDCGVGFCTGYVLAVEVAGEMAGAASNFEGALSPVDEEGRTGVVFLIVVFLVGVLGGVAGAAFDFKMVLSIAVL